MKTINTQHAIELLEKLYKSTAVIGTGFIELAQSGETNMTREEFEEVNEVLEEVEMFLANKEYYLAEEETKVEAVEEAKVNPKETEFNEIELSEIVEKTIKEMVEEKIEQRIEGRIEERINAKLHEVMQNAKKEIEKEVMETEKIETERIETERIETEDNELKGIYFLKNEEKDIEEDEEKVTQLNESEEVYDGDENSEDEAYHEEYDHNKDEEIVYDGIVKDSLEEVWEKEKEAVYEEMKDDSESYEDETINHKEEIEDFQNHHLHHEEVEEQEVNNEVEDNEENINKNIEEKQKEEMAIIEEENQEIHNKENQMSERIIVGEVRDGSAFDLLQACNTGHDGSMSSTHPSIYRVLQQFKEELTESESNFDLTEEKNEEKEESTCQNPYEFNENQTEEDYDDEDLIDLEEAYGIDERNTKEDGYFTEKKPLVFVKWTEGNHYDDHEMEVNDEKFKEGEVYYEDATYKLIAEERDPEGYFFYAIWK